MFSLLPATLNGNKSVEQTFEEMFVGAAMRRYIDPAWTTEASRNADALGGERCWWIVPKQVGNLPTVLLSYAVPGKPLAPLLVLAQTDTSIEVRASRIAVDGVGASETNQEGDLVLILKLDRASILSVAVLHQPVAPGRYSASVFVTANSANIERGEINVPLMLASFEWSPPVKDEYGRPKPALATIGAAEMSAYPTFVRWTRTSCDFDFLQRPRIEKDKYGAESWKVDRRHVREFVTALEGDHFSFKLNGVEEPVWLCPSTFADPFPVHVHRLNQPHPTHVTPSWYGDSVGHYEADTLVIDTVQ
jgi:hypothetical protein